MPTTLSETSTNAVEELPTTRAPITSTGPAVARILRFDVPEREVVLPAHSARIGDYIAEAEKEDGWKAELAKARVQFAEAMFSDQPITIRTLRLRKGFSQAQLALAIHTSQSHIARIELGRTDPGYETFKKLAAALDEDIGDVVKAYGAGRDREELADLDL